MRVRRCAWLGAAVGCVGVVALLVPAVSRLELQAGLGALFALRGPVEPPADVAAVSASAVSAEALGIDTSDIDEWPRSLHAELVDRLAAAGAALVVLDISFERASTPAEDERLARALRQSGRVVLLDWTRTEPVGAGGAVIAVRDERVRPIGSLRDAALATAPFMLPTVPIRTSQFWTFGRSGARLPNLPAVALQVHLASEYADFIAAVCAEGVDCGELPRSARALLTSPDLADVMARIRVLFEANTDLAGRLRDTRRVSGFRRLLDLYAGPASRYLNFYGSAGTIPTVPMHEILANPVPGDLAGKVVFVGVAERRQPEQQDWFYTVVSERTGQNLSGVEVGATAFANLLAGETLRGPGRLAELALVLGFGLLLGVAALPRAALGGALAGAAVGSVHFGAAYYAFDRADLWLPLVVPLGMQWPVWLVALLTLAYRDVLGQRARIEAALGRYVPRHVVRRLARESVDRGVESELLDGVCLYTDAEEFTRLSEQLAPERLARLMSEYFDVLCTTAERHEGLVTDISGDSMVAIWAATRPDAALSTSACEAALAILGEVERFNRASGAGRLPTRLGLDAGRLHLGDIGSEQRREYRAVGELVTTAARLQGLNRQLGTRVLVSAGVAQRASGHSTRPLGSFLLLGKTVAVDVCELLGTAKDSVAFPPELLEPFANALAEFARGDFAQARATLERIAAAVPDDGPTRFYGALCDRYAAEPPPEWRGTVRIDVK